MMNQPELKLQNFKTTMDWLRQKDFSVFDALPEDSLEEKLIALLQNRRALPYSHQLNERLVQIRTAVESLDMGKVKVVVLGGGSGLSNIVGGDSTRPEWTEHPFIGLKQLFPRLTSIVCITDDGGSSGEMQKDLPLVALGDLRHVLLASVRFENLRQQYKLDLKETELCATALWTLFNYRFDTQPANQEQLLADTGAILQHLPAPLYEQLALLINLLFEHPQLRPALRWPQCLGNLLLAAAIYHQAGEGQELTDQQVQSATIPGISALATTIGARSHGVLPCTVIPARLQVLYANGVLVTGETKSSKAKRGYPVDRVVVEFTRPATLAIEVEQAIREADIILLAPGSLYTSIIPILQVPGLVEAIRMNKQAFKVLIANLWVQKGETDVAHCAPNRKFHVSDLISAYHRNIPGGIKGLSSHVIALDMSNIPGSVLQRYGLEDKQPILIDREDVLSMGLISVEAKIFSEKMMREYSRIQHDSHALGTALQGLWALHSNGLLSTPKKGKKQLPIPDFVPVARLSSPSLPCSRYKRIVQRLQNLQFSYLDAESTDLREMPREHRDSLIKRIAEIIRSHSDIPVAHFEYIRGITLVEKTEWDRCQQWDAVFSFYDPHKQAIKICQDKLDNKQDGVDRFEADFLVALGQSLLGNYALRKKMEVLYHNRELVGRIFRLTVRPQEHLLSFLTFEDINAYLSLIRMHCNEDGCTYTRVVNPDEGFTPPGLFFGLFYAWYLDNNFAPNIEYKMSIMRNNISGLIPEQVRIFKRRQATIQFFHSRIFRQELPRFCA